MGGIVDGTYDGSNDSVTEIMANLDAYSQIIDGWANRIAQTFASGVLRENDKQWRQMSREIHHGLKDIVDDTPIGDVMRSIVNEQVKYMKSLPIEAADRVYDIQNRAIEAVVNGERASVLQKEIMRTGEVAESRAKLIARTEIGRANGALTQARALSVGSVGYIWRTAHDSDVRHSHKEMEGKFVAWDRPPTLDGLTGHAGCVPNCRCYPEVVFRNPQQAA
ncbi:minor capsid protein [Tatumella sp. JGM130]|uniref:phage head morphogenesis protein n=1 Tax=Tatumella sp. JGM130 TaxID=2799797 RepID=UPI001BB0464F|nr:minor capsid protein [Tatumella sp. JGM130]